MNSALAAFSSQTQQWFTQTFGEPTPAQAQSWPLIQQGANTLVIAPTGSGKTLAAFLAAIDKLMQRKTQEPSAESSASNTDQSTKRTKRTQRTKRGKGVRVLYISPLKALGVDVAKNLNRPLAGIAQQYEQQGLVAPEVRVAMRSGDTDAKQRAALTRNPPDILVTTPESLYLMLTSKAREILRTVESVIIDEVHAVAGTKRGSHLALSLERLDALLPQPAQRIGLSATVHPIEEVAAFLGGSANVHIVDTAAAPAIELKVIDAADRIDNGTSAMPDTDANCKHGIERIRQQLHLPPDSAPTQQKTASIWPNIQRSVLDLVLQHRTTLVFVNSRGVAERLTAQINDMYAAMQHTDTEQPAWGQKGDGPDEPLHRRSSYGSTSALVAPQDADHMIAMAHHGSVSKDRRKQIEDDLKHGKLRCVIATSSLELGIDMGSVDLVIQIASPLSISSGLQRIGRADHKVGGVSHAVLYPLTRQDIIATGTAVESMRTASLEPTHMVKNALDVLAQQTVAQASLEPLNVESWYQLVRKAAPFAALGREAFQSVIGLLTGAYSTEEFSAFRPPLMIDEQSGMISARPGAQRLAVTSGGTIPDRGMYTVVLPEAQAGKGPKRVGELDEEMVYETRVGDIITLGTSTWQVQEITHDRVVVVPANGRSARLPFWHGDQDGRSYTFGYAQAQWLHDMSAGLITPADMAAQAASNGEAGKNVVPTHVVAKPTFTASVMQRLHDDGFDNHAIADLASLLAQQQAATTVIPDASRIVVERTQGEEGDWTVIIHSQLGRQVHEPWALAINARLHQRYGFSGQIFAADDGIVIRLPDGDGTIDVVSAMKFDSDELTRIVTEQVGGSVLFSSRFREVAARSLFMPRMHPGKRVPLWQQRLRAAQLLEAARPLKDFPLILETMRECLQDVYDLPALREVMARIQSGTLLIDEVVTNQPSPMAEHLMFGFVGSVMYDGDTPLAERNAQLLSMNPAVLEQLLGEADYASVLDAESIDEARAVVEAKQFWNELDSTDVIGRVNRYAKTHGPFTAAMMIDDLGLDAEQAVRMLDELKARGELISGRFDARMDAGVEQWLHESVFRMIRSRSLRRTRAAIRPVAAATFAQFVCTVQGIGPVGGQQFSDVDGVLHVLEQLEGVELPLQVWEHHVLPARVRNFQPTLLDTLIVDGDVIWIASEHGVRFYAADSVQLAALVQQQQQLIEQQTPVVAHNQSDNLDTSDTSDSAEQEQPDAAEPDSATLTMRQCILTVLQQAGAFSAAQLSDLVQRRWMQQAEPYVDEFTGELVTPPWSSHTFEQTLWQLVQDGLVTNSSLDALRAFEAQGGNKALKSHGSVGGTSSRTASSTVRSLQRSRRSSMRSVRRSMRAHMPQNRLMTGMWRLVTTTVAAATEVAVEPVTAEQQTLDLVELLLDRYGVVAPAIAELAQVPGGFSVLYPVLRTMEDRGRVVRGMFVEGFGAAQFATRDTIDALRQSQTQSVQHAVALSALDPALLFGTAFAWPELPKGASKPKRIAGSLVVLRNGVPVVFASPKSKKLQAFTSEEAVLQPACAELAYYFGQEFGMPVAFTQCNGLPIQIGQPMFHALRAAGFTPSPQGMKLYR
ncbi:DEAD/DEAH box helicase [Bifidobacterium dolichotidis]|uniref:DEAD/DEAH box helicase n=1 Tax=Bifidobacterium dolichotidis TaxID=2306976 RepID=A0A430FSD0_9BIFI|nr:DEAD/DEAH box helicase [Bifidobacterium dolichotidis]RSX55786.1 DEAD/DEAH box helicase [Bifidobacterium dolichotidis]